MSEKIRVKNPEGPGWMMVACVSFGIVQGKQAAMVLVADDASPILVPAKHVHPDDLERLVERFGNIEQADQ